MIPNNEFLEHHGIHRQRWGVRRFQNYDGSLTKAGKERRKLGKRDVSNMSRFNVERYSNKDQSLTHLGKEKFATKKRHKSGSSGRSRRGRAAVTSALEARITNRGISGGQNIVQANFSAISGIPIG